MEQVAEQVKYSAGGEFEITSINRYYLENDNLHAQIMSRGFACLDMGTHEALTETTEFVKAVEKRTGLKIACLEDIGYRMGWVTKETMGRKISDLKGNYYEYVSKVVF